MDKFEGDLAKKSQELSNLINSRILNTKTEMNEGLSEVKRSCKLMVDQLDPDQLRKSF